MSWSSSNNLAINIIQPYGLSLLGLYTFLSTSGIRQIMKAMLFLTAIRIDDGSASLSCYCDETGAKISETFYLLELFNMLI
mmetsp:Transcript_11552/g.24356  ORF Transcript_11552/g.24356 Transcript_11552/m.24356 type:complete len:81 (-) Transcript_11552:239-481(-)